MDTLYYILFVLALLAAAYFLYRSEKRAKNKYKITAYNLLEEKNPDPKKIKATITCLRLYGGRFNKDKECGQLQDLLYNLLQKVEKPAKIKRTVKE